MKYNFHAHTYRCNHAQGTEEEFVQAAIAGGFDILGFSDHSPYFFDGGYYSTFRMKLEETAGYFETINALREKYKDKIEIHAGLEAEYYPKYFDKIIKFAGGNGCEYIILGQHFLDDEIGMPPNGMETSDVSLLEKYVNQTCEGMKTGMYTYFAHPDMFNFRGDMDAYRKQTIKLCETALKMGLPLEINLLGLYENRHYPYMPFWEIAAEVGNTAVIGCDAHNVRVFTDTETWDRAWEIINRLEMKTPDELKLKSIK